MYRVWNVRPSDAKVNKTLYNVMITSRYLKRFTISGFKVNIKLHGSLSIPVINKRSSIKKILNLFLLRQKEPLSYGGDLNPKKVLQRTKIKHKKLITKTSLNKKAMHSGSSLVMIMSSTKRRRRILPWGGKW
jgi:hypothetical protein